MALNLAKAVLDCLRTRPEEKLTARQIAEWIFSTYPAECQEKKSNSRGDYIKTDGDLAQQLVAEISSQHPRLQKRHPELKTTEDRPRKYYYYYYYSEKSDVAEAAAAEGVVTTATVNADGKTMGEHALYPLLSLYLWDEFGGLFEAHRREALIEQARTERLATENRDFLEYVKLVKQFYQTGEARLVDWDVATTTN